MDYNQMMRGQMPNMAGMTTQPYKQLGSPEQYTNAIKALNLGSAQNAATLGNIRPAWGGGNGMPRPMPMGSNIDPGFSRPMQKPNMANPWNFGNNIGSQMGDLASIFQNRQDLNPMNMPVRGQQSQPRIPVQGRPGGARPQTPDQQMRRQQYGNMERKLAGSTDPKEQARIQTRMGYLQNRF